MFFRRLRSTLDSGLLTAVSKPQKQACEASPLPLGAIHVRAMAAICAAWSGPTCGGEGRAHA
jgi:hypothetical protein